MFLPNPLPRSQIEVITQKQMFFTTAKAAEAGSTPLIWGLSMSTLLLTLLFKPQ